VTLSQERCEACTGETPTIGADEARVLHDELHAGWELEPDRLRRRVRTADFATALALATHIGMIAESEGHHPDLCLGWGRLDIELTTHAVHGLSRNDFIVAAKIDKILPATDRARG
jgi:4a-hydroxytetrahydrobiopterin dehydratase